MLLCVGTIILILLITRLEDIAHFASMDATFGFILLFIAYQIPNILPIAIPVSCLVSSILLVQRLSQTHELTALRACGMSFKNLFTPLLFAGAFLSLINFYLVSETSTLSHLHTHLWKSELRSLNPLLLLKNKHLMKLKGAYFDSLGSSKIGESASQVVVALPNRSTQRIHLILAGQIEAVERNLRCRQMTCITPLPARTSPPFDNLIVENIQESTISGQEFARFIQNKTSHVNNDHLTMPMLLHKLEEEQTLLDQARATQAPEEEIKSRKKSLSRGYSEIMRRLSAALAAFTFTLMGASFGVSISRTHSNRSLFYVIGLAGVFLACYFAAKGVETSYKTAAALYFLPHAILCILSCLMLVKISRGIER